MTMEHKFQVNLRGVIDLLSDNLYSGPQVYLRELLQNAVDAVVARRKTDPSHTGSITMELTQSNGKNPPTLMVQDDGVGLTEEEIHQFLATIGQSSKTRVPWTVATSLASSVSASYRDLWYPKRLS
jgi:molecular chaperone HtpG